MFKHLYYELYLAKMVSMLYCCHYPTKAILTSRETCKYILASNGTQLIIFLHAASSTVIVQNLLVQNLQPHGECKRML